MLVAPSRKGLWFSLGWEKRLYSVGSLNIRGYRGKTVQNTYFKQEGKAKHVAVVFPGYGYRCFGPVVYYPSLALLALGADVLWVEYAYDREPEYGQMRPSERTEWRQSDSGAAINEVLRQVSYDKFTLVGKSIGTLVVGDLLTDDPRLRSARAIYLTPLLKSERLRAQLERLNSPSLFVSGSADSEYDAEVAARLREKSTVGFLLLEGADHSLEVRGDPLQSLQMLSRLTEQTLRFLKE
jgi:predicted alpha/beta-hydrolase family hydrolase